MLGGPGRGRPRSRGVPGAGLSLEQVSLAEARRRVAFSVLLPPGDRFGSPVEVYLGAFPPGGRLTLAYRARVGLSVAGPSGEGLLLTQFRGRVNDVAIRKLLAVGVRRQERGCSRPGCKSR